MGEKGTFQAGIEQQLHQWQTQIESASQTIADLKEKIQQLDPDAKKEHLDQIQHLEKKIAAAKTKINEGQKHLEDIKAAGEEAWEEVKIGSQQVWSQLALGLNEAWDVMKTSLEQASSKLQRPNPKK